jgi:hypothetical protein
VVSIGEGAYEDGAFRFFEHPVHFTREQAYEGKYVIQTEEQNLSAVDAVRLYKELSEVERTFADLKDVLDMRRSITRPTIACRRTFTSPRSLC